MPLYEYQCENCGIKFEVIQRFADAPVETCRECGGKVHRLVSAPAIQFKGTGWYITDYAHKGKGSDTATVAASHSSESAKSDNGKSETAKSTDAGSAGSSSGSAPTDTKK